jgi:hypothetical protein
MQGIKSGIRSFGIMGRTSPAGSYKHLFIDHGPREIEEKQNTRIKRVGRIRRAALSALAAPLMGLEKLRIKEHLS